MNARKRPARARNHIATSRHLQYVLCIDDSRSILRLRKALLERLGYHVLTATSGKAGLRALRRYGIAAVVLDYEMPGMNGAATAAAIRRMSSVPIVLASASSDVPKQAMELMDAVLPKGEPPARLAEILRQLTTTTNTRRNGIATRVVSQLRDASQSIVSTAHAPA